MIRTDDLQLPLPNGKSLCILQDTEGFCFGVDAVLLARFAKIRKGARVLDMGTGFGVIPLILAADSPAGKLVGIDIQEKSIALAKQSAEMNELSNLSFLCRDLRTFPGDPEGGYESYDVITCNPPYRSAGSGFVSPDDSVAIARHEITCTLPDVCRTAAALLKTGGKLCMIHRPDRLPEIFTAMQAHGLEPKRLRPVHSTAQKPPVMVLIEAAKGANPSLLWEKPLVIYNESGEYSQEINEMYRR